MNNHPTFHAAAILKQILREQRGLKAAFYGYLNASKDLSNPKGIYSILINTYQHRDLIKEMTDYTFGQSYRDKDREEIYCLIYENIVKGRPIKGGGELR